MEIITKSLCIKQLLSYNEYNKFIIPQFQRPYAWTTKECEQLWDDLIALEKAKSEDQNCPDYFFGTIIVYYNDTIHKELCIIDGQQRITTLLILLRAIHKHIDSLYNITIDPEEKKKIDDHRRKLQELLWAPKSLFDLDVDINKPRLERLNCQNDHDILRNIMSSGLLGCIEEPQQAGNVIELSDRQGLDIIFDELNKRNKGSRAKSSPLKEILSSNECINYAFFLKNIIDTPQGDIAKFITLLRECFRIVILVPQDNANNSDVALSSALDIFDVLNNRGLQLTDSDILKNKISTNTYLNRLEDFGKDWAKLIKAFSEDESIIPLNLASIFRHYMNANRMKEAIGQKSKEPRLRDYYIKSEEGRQLLRQGDILNNLTQMTSFLTDALTLELDSDDTHKLISNEVKRDFTILNKYKELGLKWTYLISAFWLYYKDLAHQNTPDDEPTPEQKHDCDQFKSEFSKFVRYCTAALVLKSIIGKNSDADIPCLCEMIAIRRGELTEEQASFRIDSNCTDYSNCHIKQLARLFISEPTGEAIRTNIRTILSGSTPKLNHLVLLYAYHGNFLNHMPNPQLPLFPAPTSPQQALLPITTIEHILPQRYDNSFGTHWRKTFHNLSNDEKQRYQNNEEDFIKEYIEHLGNKMILDRERNIRASCNDFPAKIRIYKKEAKAKPTNELNCFIQKYDDKINWSKEDVDARTEKMIDVIIRYIDAALRDGI